ncbi:hypothetical protein [Cellulosilyticum ruminicola]|uniref:hypothetical protein n=1 Tax=Cellulosilyticum ruminicola TaxID=425254 RepID=UPI0006D10A24|nr:hypothetical protein [Cellulosilyticum ruminicola]
MKRKREKDNKHYILGKYSAYLTENMSMVFIFLIIVTIALSSFIKVYTLDRESNEKLMANIIAQNLVEYGKDTKVRYDDVLTNLGAKKVHGKYYFYYDMDWKVMKEKEESRYYVALNIGGEQMMSGKLKNIQVNVYRQGYRDKLIYSLSAKAY